MTLEGTVNIVFSSRERTAFSLQEKEHFLRLMGPSEMTHTNQSLEIVNQNISFYNSSSIVTLQSVILYPV